LIAGHPSNRSEGLLKRLALLLAAWIGGAASFAAFAQQPAPGAGGVAKVARVTSRVEAVDRAARTITLRAPKGGALTFAVGPEVGNFGEFRVGDIVVVRYLEALALDLKKAGVGIRERVESGPSGDTRRVTVAAEVIAKDAKKRTVTLRGASYTVELKVANPDQFKHVQVGDRVEATYTEAAATSIEMAMPRHEVKK
jgi:hypothetical protein